MEDEVLQTGQEQVQEQTQEQAQEPIINNSDVVTNNLFDEGQEVEVEKEFDPAELDLNIEADVGGYDLTKFKDEFGLDNEENLKALEGIAE